MPAAAAFLRDEIRPALAWLSVWTNRDMGPPEAQVMLLAIALQETGLKWRAQVIEPYGCAIDSRPAHGWFQFEGGPNQALDLTMRNPATGPVCRQAATAQGVEWALDHVWWVILGNDFLATVMARQLLWLDPQPLPMLGDEQGAWDLYIRCWQPGKPHRDAWASHYPEALAVVIAEPVIAQLA